MTSSAVSSSSAPSSDVVNALVADLTRARMRAEPLPWAAGQPADVPTAYAAALAVRAARIAGGEVPVGYKIGFTNRTIWPRYGVYGPVWGTVWQGGLTELADDAPLNEGVVTLDGLSEPRIEPEIVFGLRAAPPADCTLAQLAGSLAWVAHGYEIVHTHFPGWKFTGAQTVADGALHGRLLVGRKVSLPAGVDAGSLIDALSALQLTLYCNGEKKDEGIGANVLDGPVQALLHFVQEMRGIAGAPALAAGDIITTGTLTDAHAVQVGESWHTELISANALTGQLKGLTVRFV